MRTRKLGWKLVIALASFQVGLVIVVAWPLLIELARWVGSIEPSTLYFAMLGDVL